MTPHYLVATMQQCRFERLHAITPHLPGKWALVSGPEALTAESLARLVLCGVFFPDRSVHLPEEVTRAQDRVRFYLTDALFGRRGAALAAYAAETRAPPHSRSMAALEALAALRGADVGLAAAEAFVLVRDIVTS